MLEKSLHKNCTSNKTAFCACLGRNVKCIEKRFIKWKLINWYWIQVIFNAIYSFFYWYTLFPQYFCPLWNLSVVRTVRNIFLFKGKLICRDIELYEGSKVSWVWPWNSSDGEASIPELCGIWCILSLLLLHDSLWPGVIVNIRVPSMGQIWLVSWVWP